jgi:hypothetical protein
MPATASAVIVVAFAVDDRPGLHSHNGTSAIVTGSHVVADRSTGGTAEARSDDRAILATALLSDCCASSTADSAPDDCALSAATLSGRRGADCAAGCTADDRAVLAAELLADCGACCGSKSTAQRGTQVIRLAQRDCSSE